MTKDSNQQYKDKCPNCGKDYPWHPDYPKWCGHCDWNLTSQASPDKKPWLTRLYENKGKREGEKMLTKFKVLSEAELQPNLTISNALAMALSLVIHALSLAVAALGIYLIYVWWPSFMFMIIGALLVLFAWFLRPRFGAVSDDGLQQKDFPMLFSLVNKVSQSVGGEMVDYIFVDEDFNAAFGRIGLKRKSFMVIGLPLWTVLSMQERIAIIGHEASHGVNGDPARGFLIGSAISTLSKWMYFLRPNMDEADGMVMIFAYGVLWLISIPVEWFAVGLQLLNLRGSQKAEYLADYLATKAAGTSAMVSALFKLNYASLLERVLICDIYSDTQPGTDFYDCLRKRLANIPEHEKQRIRKVSVFEDATLDASHPPTAHRIDFLESRPVKTPAVTLSDDEIAQLEAEMKTLEGPTGRRIILDLLDAY